VNNERPAALPTRLLVLIVAVCAGVVVACGSQQAKAPFSLPAETGTTTPAGAPISPASSPGDAPGCNYTDSGWPSTTAMPESYSLANVTVHVSNRGRPVPDAVISEGGAVGQAIVVADSQGRAVISNLSVNDRCAITLAVLQEGQPTMLWKDIDIRPGPSEVTLDLSTAAMNNDPVPPTCDDEPDSSGSLQVVVFGAPEAGVTLLPDNRPLTSQGGVVAVPDLKAPHGDLCTIDLSIVRPGADPVVIRDLFNDDKAEVVDFIRFTT
jgi:hypothetical protein